MPDQDAHLKAGIRQRFVDLGDGTFAERVAVVQQLTAVTDASASAVAGNVDSSGTARVVGTNPMLFNGTTLDRGRNNSEQTALASASRTATASSADLVNYNGRYLTVVLDVTVVGTGSVTILIEGKDSLSGKYYTLLTGAAVITNSTNVYRVGPDLLAAANVTAAAPVPRIFRVTLTANNANALTASVGVAVSL